MQFISTVHFVLLLSYLLVCSLYNFISNHQFIGIVVCSHQFIGSVVCCSHQFIGRCGLL